MKTKSEVSVKMTNPLFIKVNEEQLNSADRKVMIVEQETWGWYDVTTSVKEGMNGYEDFFIKEKFYDGYGRSAFWKGFNYFKRELSKQFNNKSLVFIWNNISKIGRNDGKTGVTKKIRDFELEFLKIDGKSLIEHEIELIKPDIIIFLTGDRDYDISSKFKNATFYPIEITNTKKAKINYTLLHSVDLGYDIKAIRLYHPSCFGGFNYLKSDALKYLVKN